MIVLGATAGMCAVIDREFRHLGLEPRKAGRWIRVAAVACGAWVAVLGLGQILGPWLFLLVLALWAASPPALRWYVGRSRGASRGGDEYALMTTAQLCREWRATYAALQLEAAPRVRLCITIARQRCLDELERRDPGGFESWLASGASAGGSPHRFIGNEPSESPDT